MIGKRISKNRGALGKAASKLIKKSLSISKQKKSTEKSKSDLKEIKNGMAQAQNQKGTSTPKLSQPNSVSKQESYKMKPKAVEPCVGQRKKELIALTLTALQKLYKKLKKNSLGTEPVSDSLAKTKEELISKQSVALKDMCEKKKLTVSGTKRVLVKRLLSQAQEMLKCKMVRAILILEGFARSKARKQEAKERADARNQKKKFYNAASKLKKDVSTLTHDELNDVLRKHGLKVSGSKKEKVGRVVAQQREEGEVERILLERAAGARKQELLSMSTASLMKECTKSKDVLDDSLLKQILLDRLLLSETKSAASKVLDRLLVRS
jgi:hypothetical protein